MKIKLITILSIFMLFLFIGCDDPKPDNSGKLDNECKESKVCDEGLICNSENICVSGENECKKISCSGHGTCEIQNSQAVCNCEAGFHADGYFCRPNDICSDVTCSNHGECIVENDAPKCNCEANYHALSLYCISDDNPCAGITCSDHGTCYETAGVPACNCDDGYHRNGLECSFEIAEECKGVTCSGHGTCEAINHVAQCNCDDGFVKGDDLSCMNNICDPNPCLTMEGADVMKTCYVITATKFKCDCNEATGYVWDELTSKCKKDEQPCEDGNAHKDGSDNCVCNEGFTADEEHTPVKPHDLDLICSANSEDPCATNPCAGFSHQHCIEELDEAKCICDDGFEFNNDVERECIASLCNADPDPCLEQDAHRTKCTVVNNAVECVCADGFTDNNGTCEESTQCDANSCSGTNMTGECTPTPFGSVYCQCKPGFLGDDCTESGDNWCCGTFDGTSCTDNPCIGMDHSTGTCFYMPAQYGGQAGCECEDGWMFSTDSNTGVASCIPQ